MSEPITLYRDGDEVTVTSPSFARDLQAMGWTTEPEADDVPFTFKEAYVDEAEFVNISEAAPKPRRGRKPKAKA